MKSAELKEKTVQDLEKLLSETKESLRTLRFKASERQLATVNKISNQRRLIARINTVLTNKKSQQSAV